MKKIDYPVRVAHVIGKLNAAGVESVINNYFKHIDHTKYLFDFYVDSDGRLAPKESIKSMGGRYFIIPPYQDLSANIKCLQKHFKEEQYQIVHTSMNTLAPFSMYSAWKANVPIRINHNHSTAGKGETKKNIGKYVLRPFARCFATDFAACSRYAGEWLYGKKMVEEGKVKIFNNAIELERFTYNETIRNEVRRELHLENNYVIGHVGRFCDQKNHVFLIDVFEQIVKMDSSARLLLVGIGELEEKIKEKVNELSLCDKVIFLGARNDVDKLYQAMDVFVLPSIYEGLPVVGVEAQASGLPCVFSDAMTKETNICPSTEMLSLEQSSEIWAEKILDKKKNERTNTIDLMREAGFDIVHEAKVLEKYYDSLLRR